MEFTRYLRLVAANLRTARHRKSLTLEAATRGRGEYRYLWELEKGSRTPSLAKLFQLAKRYGVTVADLVAVPGFSATLDLSQEKVEPPKRGRKPKKKRKVKAP